MIQNTTKTSNLAIQNVLPWPAWVHFGMETWPYGSPSVGLKWWTRFSLSQLQLGRRCIAQFSPKISFESNLVSDPLLVYIVQESYCVFHYLWKFYIRKCPFCTHCRILWLLFSAKMSQEKSILSSNFTKI